MTKVFLVGVNTNELQDYAHAMEELALLAEACDMEVVGKLVQNMPAIHKGLYIGTGKVSEVRQEAMSAEAELVLFNDSLTPSQLKNLQDELEIAVMDRTTLILEIFASRAKSREAMLQVEVARLQYMMPRLIGLHEALTRQGGTSGSMSSRGAGEKKLELDRRRIQHRLTELRRELEQMETQRMIQQKKREKSQIPRVALVGYTNAGKSTLMNTMIDLYVEQDERDEKKVYAQDMLFATLDTTVRKITPKENKTILLSDTVGFIERLPHGLVKAFRSTLSEAVNADLILQVVDFSDVHYKQHMEVTRETLEEIGAGDIPVYYVFNKADLVQDYQKQQGLDSTLQIPKVTEQGIYMSAKNQIGTQELIQEILARVYAGHKKVQLMLPYARGDVFSYLKENANVLSVDYEAEGIKVVAECGEADYGRLTEFILFS